MEVIRFIAEGVVNSFRRIETATYQNTELTPKKTHIAGMITNILGKGEKFYYDDLLPQIKIGVVPLNLENIFVDLWQYKKWKTANQGRAIVKREKLYHAKYKIYIWVPEGYKKDILEALKRPKRSPSLGMDDELIIIKDISEVNINKVEKDKKRRIHSIFPENWVFKYIFSIHLRENNLIIPPRVSSAVLKFERGPPRRALETLRIVEFFGGDCTGEVKKDGILYESNGENIVMW